MIIQIDTMLNNAIEQEQQLLNQLSVIDRQRLETERKLWAVRGQVDLLKRIRDQASQEQDPQAPDPPPDWAASQAQRAQAQRRPDDSPAVPDIPDAGPV